MKIAREITLVAALALALLPVGRVAAQDRSSVPSRPSEAQPAPDAIAVDPSSVLGWAGRVLALIDRGEYARLWDGASSVAKRSVDRAAFVAAVSDARKPLGPVSGREWTAVRRQRNAGAEGVPAGEYTSVELVALFANKRIGIELVTFRHDEDGIWRFTGYVIR